MAKLFKNSKQVFAFVIAFAVIAVSLFTTGINIGADAACGTANIIYWDGTAEAIDTTAHAGTADDPYIIENAEQLSYVAMKMNVADTTGKYFKIADGIDAIVLQSSGAEAIMALDNADDVKAYFDNLDEPLDWMQNYAWKQFNGNFDGNGAAIYGLYATNRDANYPPSLFPNIDGGGDGTGVSGSPTVDNVGITIENVIIRNSCYINTGTNVNNNRMGAIAGHTYGTAGAGYVNGTVNFDTIEVSNCYMSTVLTDNVSAGVIASNFSNEIVHINNALVYGNKTLKGNKEAFPLYASAENSRKDSDDAFIYNTVTNSIILGTTPYNINKFSYRQSTESSFENVYTDVQAGTVTFNEKDSNGNNYKAYYTETDILQIFELTGAGIVDEAATLDWQNVWIATTGYPQLRAFHNITLVADGDNGHIVKCADCSLEATSGITAHDYDENYYCAACDYQHTHDANKLTTEIFEGNCIKDPGKYITCVCGYEEVIPTGSATGHKFVPYEEDPSDCLETGTKAHWICETCGKIYLTDDIWAEFETAVTEEELVIALGTHTQKNDSNGKVIIFNDETGHWYECTVCDGKLDYDSGEIEEVFAHDFEESVCTECGYACTEHDYQPTGVVVTMGTCYIDHVEETKCTICGDKKIATTTASHKIVKVDAVAPNDRLEGTKTHYMCEVCNSVYADAEGTTPVTRASLVIPKTLPDGFGTEDLNVDTGTKSPATSDNIMTVVATVATIAGIAFVLIRKAIRA